MKVLVTGSAGFIGNHLAKRLLDDGHDVVGIDNLNAYYDPALKQARLDRIRGQASFHEECIDISDEAALSACFAAHEPEYVVNLAAQAGVRYSLESPASYVQSNLVGFANILENCRQHNVKHLVFASTSSIYGANRKLPYTEKDTTDHQVNLYSASKKANEAMAHAYAHLFDIPSTGLRFFTVYGDWGRPDMAFFKFADAIMKNRPIDVYNRGEMTRDFTYVGDIVEGIMHLIPMPPKPDSSWDARAPELGRSGVAPYKIYNIGCGKPVTLMRYIEVLEACLGRVAKKNLMPMQPGDVKDTCADVSELATATGYAPVTSVEEGMAKFAKWYASYYSKT